MSDENAQLSTNQPSALSIWSKDSTQEKVRSLMPTTLSWERFNRLATSLIHRNPKIAECEPVSLMSVFSDCATIGVYPDPITGKAYVIPRWNSKKRVNEATLLIGYKGLRDIALRTPSITDLWTGVVRQGDTFKMTRAPKMDLIHEPLPEGTGEVIGCYSIASLANGQINYEWMSISELNKIKTAALAGQEDWKKEKSPWTLYEDEMNRKSVLRRHFKSLPLRAEDQEAVAKEVDVELNEGDVRETVTAEAPKRLPPPARSNKGVAAIKENAAPAPAPEPEKLPEPAATEVVATETPKAEDKPAFTEAEIVQEKPWEKRTLKLDEVGTFAACKVTACKATAKGSMLAEIDGGFYGDVFHQQAASNPLWKDGAVLTVSLQGKADKSGKVVNFVTEIAETAAEGSEF